LCHQAGRKTSLLVESGTFFSFISSLIMNNHFWTKTGQPIHFVPVEGMLVHSQGGHIAEVL
jgi:hypothetical protein